MFFASRGLRLLAWQVPGVKGCCCGHVTPLAARFSSQVYSESTAREHLSQFQGGSVELEKDTETGIASIILNRPEKKNALTGSMMVELHDIVADLESWSEGKGVALYGAGRTFCSGVDLDFVQQNLGPLQGIYISKYMQKMLTRLHNLPLISVALVEGQALGGGSELLTATDFRVVSEKVSMGFLQSKLGVTTGFGGGTRLVKLLGRHTALEIISSARVLSWKEGLDIGLVDAVLPDNEEFIERGKDWLADHLKAHTSVVQATKRMVVAVDTEPDLMIALEKESAVFASVWGAEPHWKSIVGPKGQK